MMQKITGFDTDELGDWYAELACGHTRHVRHDPPWQNREWVTTQQGRDQKLGFELDCVTCEQIAHSDTQS